jgi:hypothetical protein
LHTADDAEVNNFIEFGNVKSWEYLRYIESTRAAYGLTPTTDPVGRAEVVRIAEDSRANTTRNPDDLSWTKNSIHKRALLADKANGDNDFTTLKVATWVCATLMFMAHTPRRAVA